MLSAQLSQFYTHQEKLFRGELGRAMRRKIVLTIVVLLMGLPMTECGSSSQTVSPQPTMHIASPAPTKQLTTPPSACQPGWKPLCISAIDMVTAKIGWVSKTQTLQGSMLLYHTDDGGLHWKNVTPPKYIVANINDNLNAYSVFAGFSNAFFLNGTTAWILGWHSSNKQTLDLTVLHTTNAGSSWQATPLPVPSDYVYDGTYINANVTFIDPLHGWIMLSLNNPDQSTIVLLQTMNGGNTWTKVYNDGQESSFSPALGMLPSQNFDVKIGLSFRNTSEGWVVGDTGENGLFYITRDAGHTWTEQSLQYPSSLLKVSRYRTLYMPTFFTSTDGIMPVVYEPGGTILYVTHDGGLTWKGTTPVNSRGGGSFVGNVIDMQHAWTTDGRFLYTTNDSGQTWTTIAPDISFSEINQLDFASATTGWAILGPYVGGSQLLQTMDGGQTWTSIIIPDPQ